MMDEITGKGLAAGLFSWVGLTWLLANQTACLRTQCDAGDLFLAAVLGAGMLAPAGVVALIASEIFPHTESATSNPGLLKVIGWGLLWALIVGNAVLPVLLD